MKCYIEVIFATLICILSGCKPQVNAESKMEAAKQFISLLEKNDTASIYKMCDIGTPREKELRLSSFHINRAYEFIKKHGVPDTREWTTVSNTRDLLHRTKIIIPVFAGVDTTYKVDLLKVDFIIYFSPDEINNQIHQFQLEAEFDLSQIRTVGPKH